jgi:hypothetical protein
MFQNNQDTTLDHLDVLLGDVTKEVIINYIGMLSMVTIRQFCDVVDEAIEQWDCTANTKTRVKRFRDYSKLFVSTDNVLANARRELICPIILTYPEHPIPVPCCGRIYECVELFKHLDIQTNELGPNELGPTCPTCKSLLTKSVCVANHTALKNLISLLKPNE